MKLRYCYYVGVRRLRPDATPTGDETMKVDTLTLKSGLVVEWDATEGAYYVPSVDLYITIEQFNAHAGLA